MFTKRKWHEQDLNNVHKTLGLTDHKGRVVRIDVMLVLKTLKELGHTSTLFEKCECHK